MKHYYVENEKIINGRDKILLDNCSCTNLTDDKMSSSDSDSKNILPIQFIDKMQKVYCT